MLDDAKEYSDLSEQLEQKEKENAEKANDWISGLKKVSDLFSPKISLEDRKMEKIHLAAVSFLGFDKDPSLSYWQNAGWSLCGAKMPRGVEKIRNVLANNNTNPREKIIEMRKIIDERLQITQQSHIFSCFYHRRNPDTQKLYENLKKLLRGEALPKQQNNGPTLMDGLRQIFS